MQARYRDGAHAPGVALMRPRNDEAQGVQAMGSWVQREVDSLDCARRQSASQLTMQREHERHVMGSEGMKCPMPSDSNLIPRP